MVIGGATATGKTRLSLALSEGLPGAEIVCADSRQVYRGMDIGTAKPSPREQAAVPHHCLDLVDPDAPFTAADFRTHASDALRGIAARGGVALLVGGTGLYLRAVARGLPLERSGTDPAVRQALERRHANGGLAGLVGELQRRDPEAAKRVDLRNPRRVIRALERAILTGSAQPPEPVGYPAPVLWIGLTAERDRHRSAIAARAECQFANGLLDEAAELRSRHDESLAAFSAIGYREAFDVLAGRSDLAAAIDRVITRTWAYARRQRTWFQAEADVSWLDMGEGSVAGARALVEAFLEAAPRADYPVTR